MKLTKNQLRKIVKEEISKVLSETNPVGTEWTLGDPLPQDDDPHKLFDLKQNLFWKLEGAIEEVDEDRWLKDMPATENAPGYDDLESDLMVNDDYTIEDYLKAIEAFLTAYGRGQFLKALR